MAAGTSQTQVKEVLTNQIGHPEVSESPRSVGTLSNSFFPETCVGHEAYFADGRYIIARLRGDKTELDPNQWYKPEYSWKWTASGKAFPASAANLNWDDSKWGQFTLYIDRPQEHLQDCTMFYPDYGGNIGIGTMPSCGGLYKAVCQLE